MKKIIVALSLGCLAICIRAEIFGDETEWRSVEESSSNIFWSVAEATGFYRNTPELYFIAPGSDIVGKNNYTLLLGAWPHTFTLEDIRMHNDNDFYALAEKNLGEKLTAFIRVEQGVSHLHGYILDMEGYIVGTGLWLNNSWQTGDGLGIAIAHMPKPHSLPPAYANPNDIETSWELSYFLPLVKTLNAHTRVFYVIDPREELDLNEAIAAEVRLNFKF